jgi:hypothetical protein
MNMVITKIRVATYVSPMMTGISITLMALNASKPIPGQLKTISIRKAPPREPESDRAIAVNVGGAAFFSA